ncbi:Uncharacterised protein [Orientia tsutsugamushi]|uniref:Uncharacterized protein n=1 Tax=Orientia tsutsugamushi TaxID=784 RepID=A0A2R8F4H5_ORITS|nr:Uncharacterised protein [Orientia tsutsugamushi]
MFQSFRNNNFIKTYIFFIKLLFLFLILTTGSEWILEAGIKGCFNNINHEWLLNNIPMNKTILQKFLKAKYLKTGKIYPIESCAQ